MALVTVESAWFLCGVCTWAMRLILVAVGIPNLITCRSYCATDVVYLPGEFPSLQGANRRAVQRG